MPPVIIPDLEGIMRKNEIICAFYNPEVERFDKYHTFMKVVVENLKKVAPLYFEEDNGAYLIVFYRRKLKKLLKLFKDEALEFYEKIMSGKYRHCAQCGCGYLSYMPVTYRSNSGCVGKSFECEVCQEYANEAVVSIKNYARKYGTKDTLLKLLNNKFFVDDDLLF